MSYLIDVEVEGLFAMYHDPSTGSSFGTYPFPTAGSLTQMASCIARMHGAWLRPVRLSICRPIEYANQMCNYHGIYRKPGTDNFQFPSTVIVRPIYKVRYKIEKRNGDRHPSVDPIHALHDIVTRRISKGGYLHTPFLGRKDFPVSYLGPARDSTNACGELNVDVPQMLRYVFPPEVFGSQSAPSFKDTFCRPGMVTYD
jgi:CRISPR-associated protein Cas5d